MFKTFSAQVLKLVFKLTPPSRPNKVRLNVYVCPSVQSFSDWNEIWHVYEKYTTVHPIQGQGQGHRSLKCAKMADFKCYLDRHACIGNQTTSGEL